MLLATMAWPEIDPVALQLGPFPIRWYALAYIAGLILGWAYARNLVQQGRLWGTLARPSLPSLDDLLVYAALGVVFGGRLGYVLFYNPEFYFAHPGEIIAVWKGGMSFHGGLAGAALGIYLFAQRQKVPVLVVADLCATVVPIGIFLGRIANFIKPELWGRVSDVSWAMVFPGAGDEARHPSQLYEAGLEGVVLLILLYALARAGAYQRSGFITGAFAAGYGVARIICEFFREPDPQLGFLFGQATMGMLLSVPLVIAGLALIAYSRRVPQR